MTEKLNINLNPTSYENNWLLKIKFELFIWNWEKLCKFTNPTIRKNALYSLRFQRATRKLRFLYDQVNFSVCIKILISMKRNLFLICLFFWFIQFRPSLNHPIFWMIKLSIQPVRNLCHLQVHQLKNTWPNSKSPKAAISYSFSLTGTFTNQVIPFISRHI